MDFVIALVVWVIAVCSITGTDAFVFRSAQRAPQNPIAGRRTSRVVVPKIGTGDEDRNRSELRRNRIAAESSYPTGTVAPGFGWGCTKGACVPHPEGRETVSKRTGKCVRVCVDISFSPVSRACFCVFVV